MGLIGWRVLQLGLIGLLVLAAGGLVNGQTATTTPNDRSEPRMNLISAAEKHKSAAQQLSLLQEQEVARAREKHDQLQQLVGEGLVARIELEASERALRDLQTKLEATRQQVANAEKVAAEVQRAEEIAKSQAAIIALPAKNRSLVRPTVLRYPGSANWSVANLATVQAFFQSTFGRMLPTSAVGQSATHNRLGWDHRHAVDVPLHPDSTEGKALIAFLQVKGIPFLAFRGAISGVSTGPHIHIGRPSHRLG